MNTHALKRLRNIASSSVPVDAMIPINILDLDDILLSHNKLANALQNVLRGRKRAVSDAREVLAKERGEPWDI